VALFYLDDAVVDDLAGPTRIALLGSAMVFVVGATLVWLSAALWTMLRVREGETGPWVSTVDASAR
jgi:hypothetical protein